MVLEIFHVVTFNQEYENEEDNRKKERTGRKTYKGKRGHRPSRSKKITATKTNYKKKSSCTIKYDHLPGFPSSTLY